MADKRKAQAEKSRRLARERGLRDPARERRRFLILVGSLAATLLLVAAAAFYMTDEQNRDRALRDDVTTTAKARAFLASNGWHPISGAARQKFERLDTEAWLTARTDGSINALEAYLADAENTPKGQYIAKAQEMLRSAARVRGVQASLKRMRMYDGDVDGVKDKATLRAIALFRYRYMLPVSSDLDDQLEGKLEEVLDWWIHPRLEELRAQTSELAGEDDYVRFAESLGVDVAAIKAVIEVQAMRGTGFFPDGRIKILFERHIFARLTGHRYDASHPSVSNSTPGGYLGTTGNEYDRLGKAYELDPEAALKATSWGRFQIMGLNHKLSGFETVGEFVRFMSQSEANQLDAAIVGFIRTNKNLGDALRRLDWPRFAHYYNGPSPTANRYEKQMRDAYQRLVAEARAKSTAGWKTTPPSPPK